MLKMSSGISMMVSEKHLVDKYNLLLGSARYKAFGSKKRDCIYTVFQLPRLCFKASFVLTKLRS